jgi:uncharacterized protein (TIGR02246 family)
MNPQEQAIADVLKTYERALNASSTTAVMPLYATDAIFMPQHFPSSIGADAIRSAYDVIFQAITLSVTFTIAEVHQVAPGWAFARTSSAGHVTVHATRAVTAEANQELFVFQSIENQWKISRYCFCTTNPPRA